jgi:transcriptional regulator with XRE-family HTH domain
MSTRDDTLGNLLRDAREALGLPLHEVAERAGCSRGYVHKLEMNRVRTPSPRVLAGLAEALGLPYREIMRAAGYEAQQDVPPTRPGAVKRYSNAHIVELLEALRRDIDELKSMLAGKAV